MGFCIFNIVIWNFGLNGNMFILFNFVELDGFVRWWFNFCKLVIILNYNLGGGCLEMNYWYIKIIFLKLRDRRNNEYLLNYLGKKSGVFGLFFFRKLCGIVCVLCDVICFVLFWIDKGCSLFRFRFEVVFVRWNLKWFGVLFFRLLFFFRFSRFFRVSVCRGGLFFY